MSDENVASNETSVTEDPLPIGRFGRLFLLVVTVTGVFLYTAAQALSGRLFSIAVVVIGVIALVTAITGFLISVASKIEGEP